MFRSLFVLTLALLLVAGLACDDDDDNNTPADDDNDDASPVGTWPDDPKPVVGWFSVISRQTEGWVGLYAIADGIVTPNTFDGLNVFFNGSMSDNGHAFAESVGVLYELRDGDWTPLSAQPPCIGEVGFGMNNLAAFSSTSAFLICDDPATLFEYDGLAWNPIAEFDVPYGAYNIDCLDTENCLVWGQQAIFRLENRTAIPMDFPPGASSLWTAALRGDGVGFALFTFSEGEEKLYRAAENTWTHDTRFGANQLFFGGDLERIDDRYVALATHPGGWDEGTFILDGNSTYLETGWGKLVLRFAPGGGGLGFGIEDNRKWVFYSINGWDLHPLFEMEYKNDGPVFNPFFLLIADAY